MPTFVTGLEMLFVHLPVRFMYKWTRLTELIGKPGALKLPPIPLVGHGIRLFLHLRRHRSKTRGFGREGDAQSQSGMSLPTGFGAEMRSSYCSNDSLIVVG